jgi:hypothetical protein
MRTFAVGLCLLLVSTAALAADDFSDAPKKPKNGECIGYPSDPSIMPEDVKHALDAVNAEYRRKANEGDARFLRETGDAGKQWKQEDAANTQRFLAGMSSAQSLYTAIPVGPNGALPSDEELRDWHVKMARWHLAVVKVENRQRQEEAEADLRFVERGGNPVALDSLRKDVKQVLETCERDGDRIYKKWWDEKKGVASSSK